MGRKPNPTSDVKTKASAFPACRIAECMDREPKTSSTEMAKHLGCTPQAINQYRQGTSSPTCQNLMKIAKKLGVTTDYLLGAADCPTPDIEKIHERIGLSEGAISQLEQYCKSFDDIYEASIPILISSLLETETGKKILSRIALFSFAKFDAAYDEHSFYSEDSPLKAVVLRFGKTTEYHNECFTIDIQKISDSLLLDLPSMLKEFRETVDESDCVIVTTLDKVLLESDNRNGRGG